MGEARAHCLDHMSDGQFVLTCFELKIIVIIVLEGVICYDDI